LRFSVKGKVTVNTEEVGRKLRNDKY
jgi:hypothetical protein